MTKQTTIVVTGALRVNATVYKPESRHSFKYSTHFTSSEGTTVLERTDGKTASISIVSFQRTFKN